MLTSAKMGQYGATKHTFLRRACQYASNHFSTVSGWGTVVDQMLMIGGKIGLPHTPLHIKTENNVKCSIRV